MGKVDILTKDYMSDPTRFADAFNYFMFNGQHVIREETLNELDPTEIGIIVTDESMKVTQKFRDILKQCILMENEMATYLILGAENQTDINYATVVKDMIYDALRYGKQVSQKAKQHRELKDITGSEFLSGFAKTDRLKPIITLTIYFGADDWDAPRSLHDMFETKNQNILRYVNDYKLNLIVPSEINDFKLFTSDLRQVMQFIAGSNNEEFIRSIQGNKDFESVQAETVRLINACTNAKIRIPEGAKEVNMCKGMIDYGISCKSEGLKEGREEGRKEGREEGIQQGIQQGIEEGLLSSLRSLMKSMHLSAEQAMNALEIPEDKIDFYRTKLAK
jgi:hypothetical protein